MEQNLSYNDAELVEYLRKTYGETYHELEQASLRLGFSRAYLWMVVSGRKPITKNLADRVGFTRIVKYEAKLTLLPTKIGSGEI